MNRAVLRVLLSIVIALIGAACHAQTGSIRLTSYPSMTVADGRSTITITAEVRDRDGRTVPDGTQVVFTATVGSFNEPIVKTTAGTARAIYTAGSVPGTSRIQASAFSYNAVSTLDVEMVADRSMLSSAKEYIEVIGEKYLMYSLDQRILGAAAPDRGVTVRYRDITIEADDVQIEVSNYLVRARKARLKFGTFDHQFEELNFKLNSRKGWGVTIVQIPNYEIRPMGSFFKFVSVPRSKLGIAEVSASGVAAPSVSPPVGLFDFADLLDSTSTVAAKKAVAFPRGQIQFHEAELYVGTNRVMKLPLFQLNMYSGSALVTDQVLNVYNSQLSVNYPYYLSLKPGESSVLRFRTGERYGRTNVSTGGMFLDYEMTWNRGDDMDGGLTVSGLTRSDWSIGARQFMRLDDKTIATAQIEFPAHQSMFGSATLNRQLDGFQLSLSANHSRSLRGLKYSSQNYSAVLERDPIPVGNLPIKMFYGLSASYNEAQSDSLHVTQNSVGARMRFQLIPIQLGPATNISGSFLASHQSGSGIQQGISTMGDVSVSHRFGDWGSLVLGYSYANDGYMSKLTGRNTFNASGYVDRGRLSMGFSLSKSLDIDRQSLFFDSSYEISSLWRLSYQLTFDRYLGDRFTEDMAMLSYRFGIREIGVSYSIRNRKFGFQLFGAQF